MAGSILLPLLLLGTRMLLPTYCNVHGGHHDGHSGGDHLGGGDNQGGGLQGGQDLDSQKHYSNAECVPGHYRAMPGTHCKMFQECYFGHWYHEGQMCGRSTLWSNDQHACIPDRQVDTTTCLSNSGQTHQTSHTSAPSTHHCSCFYGQCDQNNNCQCQSNYHGTYCQLHEVTKTNNYCGGRNCYHGKCVYDYWHHTHLCECYHGYTGHSCYYYGQSSTIPPTSPQTTTIPTTSTQAPSVTFGYAAYNYCGSNRCYFGDCDTVNAHICNCYPTYLGASCEQKQLAKTGIFCDNKPCYSGLCVFSYQQQEHQCDCYPGYTGLFCNRLELPHVLSSTSTTPAPPVTTTSFQPKLCANKPCYFGECDSSNNGICKCHQKYFGDFCHQTQITASNHSCSGVPCYNGLCIYDYKIKTYECACYPGYNGEHCDKSATSTTTTTQPTTTAAATTNSITPSTPSPTTTSTTASTPSLPSRFNTCKKFSTVLDLGNHVAVNNTHLQGCPSGSFATPEAFVIGHCNVTSPNTWQQGTNVMQSCTSIPLYTPVATFIGSHYSSSGSLSGIFLGCVKDGFKLGAQRCDRTPAIDHIVDGGMFTMDPHLYFTV